MAACTTSAAPGPAPATSTPPTAGPAIIVAARDIPSRAFAGCSRAALTVSGISAEEAGMKIASPAPNTNARAASIQISAAPASTSAAVTAWATSRRTSAISTSRRREMRSAHTPATSTNTVRPSACAPSTSPRSPAPPRSSTANVIATGPRASPNAEKLRPMNRSRKSRSRRAARSLRQLTPLP